MRAEASEAHRGEYLDENAAPWVVEAPDGGIGHEEVGGLVEGFLDSCERGDVPD